jgi:hypothetical protein
MSRIVTSLAISSISLSRKANNKTSSISLSPENKQVADNATDENFVPNHAHRNLDENSCRSRSCVLSVTTGSVSYFWDSIVNGLIPVEREFCPEICTATEIRLRPPNSFVNTDKVTLWTFRYSNNYRL